MVICGSVPAYSRNVEGNHEREAETCASHAGEGDNADTDPVAKLDKIKRHRQEIYLENGSVLPVQPAELKAGLTQADIDSQTPAC